jgi:hypothetical protein
LQLKESKEGEQITVASEITEAKSAADAVTPLANDEGTAFDTAKKFFEDLEPEVKTPIDKMIGDAMKKDNAYLDITDDQKTKTGEKWEETSLFKREAETQLKEAAEIQHKPTRDAWFTKLGLSNKEAKYNWLPAGAVGGDNVHETLHHTSLQVTHVVTTNIDTLKNQILGRGRLAYHVSLETTTEGKKNSHSYRGPDEIIRHKRYRDKHGFQALTRQELSTQLAAKRDACINRVEPLVKDAQDNKGRGMMTEEVVKKLGIG